MGCRLGHGEQVQHAIVHNGVIYSMSITQMKMIGAKKGNFTFIMGTYPPLSVFLKRKETAKKPKPSTHKKQQDIEGLELSDCEFGFCIILALVSTSVCSLENVLIRHVFIVIVNLNRFQDFHQYSSTIYSIKRTKDIALSFYTK